MASNANDVIVIEYQANMSKLEASLNKTEKDLLALEKDSKASMTTLSKESNKAAASVDKVDKQVNGLGTSLSGLLDKLPFAGAIQEVKDFSNGIKDIGTSVNSATKSIGVLKTAFQTLGIGFIITAIASLVAYFKSTEEGGDRLAKILRVIGGIVGEATKLLSDFGGAVFDAGESIVDYVSGAEEATTATDDYSKSVVELSAELADLEDHISALIITIELQNSKFQTGIEGNLRKLRNQNNTYKESLDIIEEIKLQENARWVNSIQLTEEQIEAERKQFLLKSQDFGASKERIQELMHLAETSTSEEDKWRREYALNELKRYQSILDANKKQGEFFDKFINGQINAEQFLNRAKGTYGEEDVKRVQQLLLKKEEANRQSLNLEERLENFKDAAFNKEQARQEKARQDADKAFQARLKQINDEEKLATEKAKIENKNQGELLSIQEQFNFQRIKLFEDYNKTNETEYKEFLLKSQALEKAYSAFLVSEEQARLVEIKKHRELILAETDKTFKAEQNLAKENTLVQFEQLAQAYKDGLIKREEFEEQSAQLSLNIQKQAINDEIDLIEQKLEIVQDDVDKRTELEGLLIDKKKALYDLDLAAFEKAEDKKTKKQKEEDDKRKVLTQKALDESINIAQQALQGFNDLQLARQTQEIENERATNESRNAEQLKNLEIRKNAGLISEAEFNAQKAKLDQQAAQKESELKRRQFKAEQDASINKINIDLAAAIIKTYAQFGFTPIAGIAIGGLLLESTIQKALVRNQPVPQFKDGVIRLQGPGTETSDSIPAMLSKNESVIKAKQSIKHTGDLEAIQGDYFKKHVYENYIVPALKQHEAKKRMLQERQASTAENIMKSLELNGFGDLSHLERLTKSNKKVYVQNIEGMPRLFAKEMSRVLVNKNELI